MKDKSHQIENKEVVEVLYQKMGDRWFAFSLIDDEVFVGSIPVSEIEKSGQPEAASPAGANLRSTRQARRDRFSGNS